jgi:hypothetical protein
MDQKVDDLFLISSFSLLKNSTFDQVPGWYDPKPFVPLRDSAAQPLIRCQDGYDPKPIKRSSMIVDGGMRGLDPKPKDPKPAGAVGYDPKPFVPLRDSVAQPLVKGFLRERDGERGRERERDQRIKAWEGRKEGRKEKVLLVFWFLTLKGLCEEGMSTSRRLGLLPREGKRKRFLSFGRFGLFLRKFFGFWFLMVDWWGWWDKSLDYYQIDRTKSLGFLLKVKKAQNQRLFHLFLISFFFFFFFFSKLIESPSVRMKVSRKRKRFLSFGCFDLFLRMVFGFLVFDQWLMGLMGQKSWLLSKW